MPEAGRPAEPLARLVQRWQRRAGRHDLPWQQDREPYRVWLSEVMLQQTQVATVLPYFQRFVERLPSVDALAAASADEVLALWSGLGYYSRARHLHQAARQLVAEHGGRFPSSAEELVRLPGIGRSTAAAIAAFCFGERVAILDGNVKRVLARALGFERDLAQAAAVEELWTLAEALLPERDIATYTQGLMDLGATVCLARAPKCGICPLRGRCVARARGDPERLPIKSRRAQRSQRRDVWLWLVRGGCHWLVPRPPRGIWGGLISLPEFASIEQARQTLNTLQGRPQALPPFVHTLTHRDWTLEPWRWRLPLRQARAQDSALLQRWPRGRWLSTEEALASALPAPLRRLIERSD